MKKIATILMMVTMASLSWADLILEYDMAAADGRTAQVAATATNTAASTLTATGVNTRNPSQGYTGMVAARNWPTASNPALGKYFEFSLTADPGNSVTYDSLTLALFRDYRNANRHGAESWQMHASTDGFSLSDILLLSLDISGSSSNEQIVFSDQDISAFGTQVGTVTFRLYGYDRRGSNVYAGLANEDGTNLTGTGTNLILNGFVNPPAPLPEPMTIVVLALGAALGILRRSR